MRASMAWSARRSKSLECARSPGRARCWVTPGVRSTGASTRDQKRVATPAEAIANGAGYLVIGRQVTRSSDPRAEFLKICEEIKAVP
jgi:orotidine-5'-phosphate decarboxylase